MDWTIVWWILGALIVIAGLAGTIIPTLPGIPLIFVGIVIVAWTGDFEAIGWKSLAVLVVLTIIGWAVDFIAGAAGARYLGASQRSFWGATFGAVVGVFFGLPGLILGPFIGAVVGELGGGRPLSQSSRAGVGAWLGMVFATAAKLAIAFLMIGIAAFRIGFGGS